MHLKVSTFDMKLIATPLYFFGRVTGAGMGFLHKLHIIYLINDVLHNATRKTTLNVKSQLQEVIVPIYCHTFVGETQENQQRCEKVVRIWETNSYFDSDVLEVSLKDLCLSLLGHIHYSMC